MIPSASRFNCQAKSDLLVIGGGIAGLMAAIRAKEFVPRVMVVDKAKIGRSGCSPFAAGIFFVFFLDDDLGLWVRELLERGEYLNNQHWAEALCLTSYKVASQIDQWSSAKGLKVFEKDDQGRFIRKKSRGHIQTSHCVINALPMMDTLVRVAREAKVEFLERVMVTDLVQGPNGEVVGAQGFDYHRGDLYHLGARAVLLAAGGCAFKSIFLGVKNLTGDMQAAAWRAGAVFKNMEQFNSNTCFKGFDTHGMNLFVNVGGKFINSQGEDFMWKYRPDLGPRARQADLVLAFCREVKEGRGPVHLDLRAASPEGRQLCRKILPESFKAWDRSGLDPFAQPVEWVPAFQGTIGTSGGVDIDLEGRTSIPGLFAAGDTTWLPSNGTAGVGGTALGFAAISGYLAGEAAGKEVAHNSPGEPKPGDATQMLAPVLRCQGADPDDVILKLQRLLIDVPVAYLKTEEDLKRALAELENIKALVKELRAADLHQLVKCFEARNMTDLAGPFLEASLLRQESRGFHFREEYPVTDNNNWLKWVLLKKEDKGVKLWTEDIPTPFARPEKEQDVPAGIRRN